MTQVAPMPVGPVDVESVFDRDRFLLRQKMVAINQKYFVSDEHGQPILFVERPAHLFRGIAALLAGLTVLLVMSGLLIAAMTSVLPRNSPLEGPAIVAGLLMGIASCILVVAMLIPLRHVTFYLDKNKTTPLLKVTQEKKWEIISANYAVRTVEGEPLAVLRKNYLWNIIRRRWQVRDPEGAMVAMAIEDSIWKSLLRRVLGQYGALIRTNFIILAPDLTGRKIGEFNRKFTIMDKYVLDMTGDADIVLDRRVALALGVMMDTGERR